MRVLRAAPAVFVSEDEIEFTAIRAQGPGGQNVNKVSNAAQLRFDIRASSLPEPIKARLLALRDRRINGDGVIVIKAQASRSLERNRVTAMEALGLLISSVAAPPKPRTPTKPTRASVRRRIESKAARATLKAGRAKVTDG